MFLRTFFPPHSFFFFNRSVFFVESKSRVLVLPKSCFVIPVDMEIEVILKVSWPLHLAWICWECDLRGRWYCCVGIRVGIWIHNWVWQSCLRLLSLFFFSEFLFWVLRVAWNQWPFFLLFAFQSSRLSPQSSVGPLSRAPFSWFRSYAISRWPLSRFCQLP